MNYETFTEMIKSCLQVQLGEHYKVETMDAPRNNRNDYTALMVLRLFPVESKIGRLIDMEKIYGEYLEGETLKECVNKLVEIFTEAEDEKAYSNITEEVYRWEWAKDRVYPLLVTREGNEKYLSTLLHRPFLNLEIIYYLTVQIDGVEGNIKVTKALSGYWNCSEEAVYKRAMVNMEFDGYDLIGLGTLIEDMTGLKVEENDNYMYVLSNGNKRYGAAGILSRDTLEMCADKIQESFYLLPSSIHEMIVVPDMGMVNAKELSEMVAAVNREQVMPEERLSEHVFYYDLEKQELQVAG